MCNIDEKSVSLIQEAYALFCGCGLTMYSKLWRWASMSILALVKIQVEWQVRNVLLWINGTIAQEGIATSCEWFTVSTYKTLRNPIFVHLWSIEISRLGHNFVQNQAPGILEHDELKTAGSAQRCEFLDHGTKKARRNAQDLSTNRTTSSANSILCVRISQHQK